MDDLAKRSEIFSLADRLISLILEMSEEQQAILLEELELKLANERRRHQRTPLRTPVDYAFQDRVYRDFIQDISGGGVYIQSSRDLPVGEEILLIFSTPGHQKHVKIKGRIVRATDTGIGVKFEGKQFLDLLSVESLWNDGGE